MKSLLTTLTFLGLSLLAPAQVEYRLGGGYVAEKLSSPGAFAEISRVKNDSKTFSYPLSLQAGFFKRPDYSAIQLELRTGWEAQFPSKVILAQSLGIGVIGNLFDPSTTWYIDEYSNKVRYVNSITPGLLLSVNGKIGYQISEKGALYAAPRIYWNFMVRGLNAPFGAIQFGYSHKILK